MLDTDEDRKSLHIYSLHPTGLMLHWVPLWLGFYPKRSHVMCVCEGSLLFRRRLISWSWWDMWGRHWGGRLLETVCAVVWVALGKGSVGLGLRSRVWLSTVGRVVQTYHEKDRSQQNKQMTWRCPELLGSAKQPTVLQKWSISIFIICTLGGRLLLTYQH